MILYNNDWLRYKSILSLSVGSPLFLSGKYLPALPVLIACFAHGSRSAGVTQGNETNIPWQWHTYAELDAYPETA